VRDPRAVARALLGKVLVRGRGKRALMGRIVEVEAYLGAGDAAAHAASGLTRRNAVIFGPGGHAYVYFTYGMHYCLNVSCMEEGEAGCVLIRALEPLAGQGTMARRRGLGLECSSRNTLPGRLARRLASGPAMLCEAFAITRARDNGRDLTSKESGLWIGDDGYAARRIVTARRIGISKSAELPLRYFLSGNGFVSRS